MNIEQADYYNYSFWQQLYLSLGYLSQLLYASFDINVWNISLSELEFLFWSKTLTSWSNKKFLFYKYNAYVHVPIQCLSNYEYVTYINSIHSLLIQKIITTTYMYIYKFIDKVDWGHWKDFFKWTYGLKKPRLSSNTTNVITTMLSPDNESIYFTKNTILKHAIATKKNAILYYRIFTES